MTRFYCFETEKDRGKGIHLLRFAARESVQECLGFSLFELVFGHTVGGPLKLPKKKLSSSSTESVNLFQVKRFLHCCQCLETHLILEGLVLMSLRRS